MHETLDPTIKGYIDSHNRLDSSPSRGWLMRTSAGDVLIIRAICSEGELDIITEPRVDVDDYYEVTDQAIGWKVECPFKVPVIIQIKENDLWKSILTLPPKINIVPTPSVIPTAIIIDNFYESPDEVRTFALSCDFKEHATYHKGRRTDECYRFAGLKERFEEILGKKIPVWDKYGTNGCFQYCIGGDQLVYHHDLQTYAGVLYLTPDAPVDSGTNLYRSKNTKLMNGYSSDYSKTYPTGHLDPSQFECVDVVGNVYNRLILFNSHTIHAASSYFGNTRDNGRLFQLFFFDVEA